MTELPKLELGDVGTRASRLLTWKVAVEQTIAPVGAHAMSWWKWCLQQAEKTYRIFLRASVHEREAILPREILPAAWQQIDSWMRPKLLEATPTNIKEWVTMRQKQCQVDASHVILYHLMKTFAPGSAEVPPSQDGDESSGLFQTSGGAS